MGLSNAQRGFDPDLPEFYLRARTTESIFISVGNIEHRNQKSNKKTWLTETPKTISTLVVMFGKQYSLTVAVSRLSSPSALTLVPVMLIFSIAFGQ